MSQENVEFVMQLQVAPDVDIAELLRSDERWSGLTKAVGSLFHHDCESVAPGVPGTERVYVGLDGLRKAWLEWLSPWQTYRTEIKQAFDGGDRVLLLTHDFGRRDGAVHEVKVEGSAVWTIREGKVARAEFFSHRSDAFAAAGLPGS